MVPMHYEYVVHFNLLYMIVDEYYFILLVRGYYPVYDNLGSDTTFNKYMCMGLKSVPYVCPGFFGPYLHAKMIKQVAVRCCMTSE